MLQITALTALFAALAAAESTTSVSILIPGFDPKAPPSITAIASNAQVTTYSLSCKEGVNSLVSEYNSGLSAYATQFGDLSSLINDMTSDVQLPQITGLPDARKRREYKPRGLGDMLKRADDPLETEHFCLPFTIVQGPSTYEAHLSISEINIDLNMACNFGKGEIFKADATCTSNGSGNIMGATVSKGPQTTTMGKDEYAEWVAHVPVTIAAGNGKGAAQTGTTTQASGAGASTTPSGTGAAPPKSTGMASGLKVSSSVSAMIGAAGVVLGAALAL
ncbi:hypothetical protein GQ43DRAFT_49457 [Delitschia confertaspora ATCC 74209]|uniref:Uncharacterized protein n=1 Tax=Delitschia confertaspora ATCC 74209 TaxID=1513339 RepID=A0A9P4JR20_9PLEO|nr:hypothetical protein GQ43DRAFT_49457 [Delitschia confertaspora ATCC 74209]